jgi:1,5-anhydro-D-fructose reductase (1,5-anhydro-D-mannitol-forming)
VTVRWGLVGVGWVARDFVMPAMEGASNARLVAVADKLPGYLTFDQMLNAGVDAVYIATPNDSHAELTRLAAQAGKHVLCEKPMATNLSDAQAMVQACALAGVRYGTAFDQRFHAAHVAVRGLIAQGQLGTVTAARIHYACWLPGDWAEDNWRVELKRAGGGAFLDLAPHGVDLLQYLLDERMEELLCLKQRRVFEYEVDDGAVAVGRMASGALCTLQVAYNCPDAFPRRCLEIFGTDAMVTARDTMGQTAGGRVEMTESSGRRRSVLFEETRSPFLNQIAAFSQCILDGTDFPFPAEGDLYTMELISRCL